MLVTGKGSRPRVYRCLFGRPDPKAVERFLDMRLKEFAEKNEAFLKNYAITVVNERSVPSFYRTRTYTVEERRKRIAAPSSVYSNVHLPSPTLDDEHYEPRAIDPRDLPAPIDNTDSEETTARSGPQIRGSSSVSVISSVEDDSPAAGVVRRRSQKQSIITNYFPLIGRKRGAGKRKLGVSKSGGAASALGDKGAEPGDSVSTPLNHDGKKKRGVHGHTGHGHGHGHTAASPLSKRVRSAM